MTITCYDDRGWPIAVPQEQVTFSPAVYGVLVENHQVLLHAHPLTGLWQPPGGALAVQETPGQAARRTFRALTGLTPALGPLLYVEERYAADEAGHGRHYAVMYYALERHGAGAAGVLSLEHPARPEWVMLSTLERRQLQFGFEAIQTAWLRLRL